MLRQHAVFQTAPADGGNGGGGAPPAFFSDEQKDYVANKGWKNAAEVITGYQGLEKLLGADKAGRTVVLPKDDNDADGRKAFFAKIGVPEKADGYALPDVLKDDPLTPAVRESALKHGIPAKALAAFVSDIHAAATKAREAEDAKIKGEDDLALATLRNEWGNKFDENDALAARYLRESGFTDDEMKALKSALGPARFMKQFHALGAKLAEPAPGGGTQGGGGGNLSALQAQKEIEDLRTRRLENKISENEFNTQIERLGPIAFP